MKQRHLSRPEMQWVEMDVLNLNFEKQTFDLVIDKGMFSPRLIWRLLISCYFRYDGVSFHKSNSLYVDELRP